MIDQIIIRNFKAIGDSGELKLHPLTVFIGNNGTGKSSVLEALRMLQSCVKDNLQEGFKEWGGLDRVHNYREQGGDVKVTEAGFRKKSEGIFIMIQCSIDQIHFEYNIKLNTNETGDFYVVESENLYRDRKFVFEAKVIDNEGNGSCNFGFQSENKSSIKQFDYKSNHLLLSTIIASGLSRNFDEPISKMRNYILGWQFLHLNAHDMGKPVLQNRLEKDIELSYDGRNIAEYVLWLRTQSEDYVNGLINRLQFVLPYLQKLQPNITGSINPEVELLMHEDHPQSRALPGWLLSSGTLRIAALLSMFDSPKPPSVLFIDEIENGLDPRTIGFLIEEIRNAVQQENPMQVICTTHSPYLLDLIPLENIIVTERGERGSQFYFPGNDEALRVWKEKFSPGKLYTIGKLNKD